MKKALVIEIKSNKHPLAKGRHGLRGVNPVFSQGKLSSFSANYTDINGLVCAENFSIKKYGLENALNKAKLCRLQGLYKYHLECIKVIACEVKRLKEKGGGG